MKVILDIFGRSVRLTEERWGHIVETHPEMVDQLSNLEETLINPYAVIESMNDNAVQLFYRAFRHLSFGEKYFCVVVKTQLDDAFIITAYITDTIKKDVKYGKKYKSMVR
ncbi:MAG: hypothetical protein FDX18_10985 [Chlorobium sp.]|nr:MAG: hypothetical protein FDX18_10985 [Chlorobium sp.]